MSEHHRRPPSRRPLFVGRPSVALSRSPAATSGTPPLPHHLSAQPPPSAVHARPQRPARLTPSPPPHDPSPTSRPARRSGIASTSYASGVPRSLFDAVAAPLPARPAPRARKAKSAATASLPDSDEEPTLSGVRQVLVSPSRRGALPMSSPSLKRRKPSLSPTETHPSSPKKTDHLFARPAPVSAARQQEIDLPGGPSSVINSVMQFGKYRGNIPDFGAHSSAPSAPAPAPAQQGGQVEEEAASSQLGKAEDVEAKRRFSKEEGQKKNSPCAPREQQKALVQPPLRQPRLEPLPESVAPAPSWPPHFVRLEQTFRAVTMVSSFVGAHKHIVLSFHMLRSSVENLLKRYVSVPCQKRQRS